MQRLVDFGTAAVWEDATHALIPAGMLPPPIDDQDAATAQAALR